MLREMKEKWVDINIEMKPFKTTNIVIGWDNYNTVLDEHIVNT
jgi:hypothetical protein